MKLKLREQMEKLRGVKQYQHQTGITLIALVITIVVLLVLAAVSINTLFNDNGIINSASKSGDKYKMEAVREQIEAERVNWEADRVVDNTKKVEDFFDALEKADIIDSAKEDVGEPETTTEGKNEVTKYEITTKEGYIVEVIITKKPDGSTTITIGDIEESKNPLPNDEIPPQEAEVNFSTTVATIDKEMTATVTLKDNESGINVSKSKWIFNQTSTAIGTVESSYANTFTSEIETIKLTPNTLGSWYLHILSVDKKGNKKETIKGPIGVEIVAENYTWTQSKTKVTGTPKAGGNTITREVGGSFGYDCGVSSYTGGWGILGAENGKLLIMSTSDIGTLYLSGKEGYNTGISKLNEMCKPYGTNARSIEVKDINRVTGYDPNNTGDGKKYGVGKWNEYGSKVTYTASKITNSNGLTYTEGLDRGKYEHPDGREIGTNGVTSITETSTFYYYYPNTLTSSNTGTNKGISTASKAYKLLFRNVDDSANCRYLLASQTVNTNGNISGFSLRFVNDYSGSVATYELWYSNGSTNSLREGVRAVVSL